MKLYTYLNYGGNCREAFEFYAKQLGGTITMMMTFDQQPDPGNAPPGSLHPRLSWLSPSGLTGTSIVTASLIAVFIYWGWDTAVATNEEADDPATTPSRRCGTSTPA